MTSTYNPSAADFLEEEVNLDEVVAGRSATDQRIVLGLDDLLGPENERFWTNPVVQDAIADTYAAVRSEITAEDRALEVEKAKRKPSEALEVEDNETQKRMEIARKKGPMSPEYQALALDLYRRALRIGNEVTDYKGHDRERIAARVVDEFLGLGPIQPILVNPAVTEIMVNDANRVFFERDGQMRECPAARFHNAAHLYDVVERFLLVINLSVTPVTPLVDGQLTDGSRVNVTASRVTGETTLTIRRFPVRTWTMLDLVDRGAMSMPMALDLATWVRARNAALISGGTGSGKTTVLNAISGCIVPDERLITIEDSRELRLDPACKNAVNMVAAKGTKELQPVTMQELVKNSLRMRPDRIIVGEIRDQVVFDFLQACATGHDGSASTIHANSAKETISRINLLISQSGINLPDDRAQDAIGYALNLIVATSRYPDGSRRVSEIAEVAYDEDGHRVSLRPLWVWDADRGEHVKVNEPGDRVAGRVHSTGTARVTEADLQAVRERAAEADRASREKILQGGV